MSHRGNLTERLAMIPLLLTERSRTQRELAEQFSVNPKTIRRNIDELSRHHPIVIERKGREVRYGFSRDHRFHSPVFTPGELSILVLAHQSIAATGLTGVGAPYARFGPSLLKKVRESLPQSLRQTLDALAVILGSATEPAKDFSPYADIIDRLTQAALARRRVRLRYYTLQRDAVTQRTIDPYVIYFDPDGATLKLIGYDNFRSRITAFAIDHIRSLTELRERFKRPANFNLQEHLNQNCFNGIHGEPITVRLRAYGVTARVFAERKFHPSQRILEARAIPLGARASRPHGSTPRGATTASVPGSVATGSSSSRSSQPGVRSVPGAVETGSHSSMLSPSSEQTTTIEMRVASGRGLLRFILGWGHEVEVLAPESLRQEVASAHLRARQGYESGSESR